MGRWKSWHPWLLFAARHRGYQQFMKKQENGKFAIIGDLVQVYNFRGRPTKIIGVVSDVFSQERTTNNDPVKYIKLISTSDANETDWILAKTVRIISEL